MVGVGMSVNDQVKFKMVIREYRDIAIGVLFEGIDECRRFGSFAAKQVSLSFAPVQLFEDHLKHLDRRRLQ